MAGSSGKRGIYLVAGLTLVNLIAAYLQYQACRCPQVKHPDNGKGISYKAGVASFYALLESHGQQFVDTIKSSGSNTDKIGNEHSTHRYQFAYGLLLHPMIGKKVKMLEIGLGCNLHWGAGASIPAWKAWFGTGLSLDMLEFDRPCAEKWSSKVNKMWIGDQSDRTLLRSIVSEAKAKAELYGTSSMRRYNNKAEMDHLEDTDGDDETDVIVDDGGHSMDQQIISWQELWALKPGGIYVIEDLHTSYMGDYEGGFRKPDTTIEYIKNSIDAFYPNSIPQDTFYEEARHVFEIHATFCWAELCAFIKNE